MIEAPEVIGVILLWLGFAFAMGLGRINPGCATKCCPSGCDIFSDDFSVDNLVTNYTTNSGTGTVASGYLSTASTGYNITGNTVHTSSNMKVAASVWANNSGDQPGIKVAETDSANYLFGRLEVVLTGASGGGTLSVGKVEAGVETVLDSVDLEGAFNEGVSYTLTVCYAEGFLHASVTNGVLTYSAYSSVTSTGTKWGLLTGTVTSEVRFDDVNVDAAYDATHTSCDPCAGGRDPCCGTPPDDVMPDFVVLRVANMVDDNCSCSSLNGSWVTPRVAQSSNCSWIRNDIPFSDQAGDCLETLIFLDLASLDSVCGIDDTRWSPSVRTLALPCKDWSDSIIADSAPDANTVIHCVNFTDQAAARMYVTALGV